MTKVQLTTRSSSRDFARVLSRGSSFATHGALRGERVPVGDIDRRTVGQLSGGPLERFKRDAPFIRYVVYSYDTPIAWCTGRGWYVVEWNFSVTTSRHQSKISVAIDYSEIPKARCDCKGQQFLYNRWVYTGTCLHKEAAKREHETALFLSR